MEFFTALTDDHRAFIAKQPVFFVATAADSVDAIVGSSPNLKGVTGAKMRTELGFATAQAIVLSAVSGAIEKNPEAGLKMASDPKYAQYISGDKVKSLEREARQVQRADQAEIRLARQERRLMEQDRSDAVETEYLKKLYFDTVVFDERELRHLIDIWGADHIMLGTDYPFDMAEPDPVGFLSRTKGVSEKDMALVAGGNAARLLGLPPAKPAKAKTAKTKTAKATPAKAKAMKKKPAKAGKAKR